jgi:hypothetical protein
MPSKETAVFTVLLKSQNSYNTDSVRHLKPVIPIGFPITMLRVPPDVVQ